MCFLPTIFKFVVFFFISVFSFQNFDCDISWPRFLTVHCISDLFPFWICRILSFSVWEFPLLSLSVAFSAPPSFSLSCSLSTWMLGLQGLFMFFLFSLFCSDWVTYVILSLFPLWSLFTESLIWAAIFSSQIPILVPSWILFLC